MFLEHWLDNDDGINQSLNEADYVEIIKVYSGKELTGFRLRHAQIIRNIFKTLINEKYNKVEDKANGNSND